MVRSKVWASVVIPVFNEEELLPGCLASVVNQDFAGRFEIVVVDNNSTDRSVAIARSYGVRVVSEPRQGCVFARDRGFWESRGEVICNLDADAQAPSNWLDRIVRNFKDNPSVGAVTGPYIIVDGPGWVKGTFLLYAYLKPAVEPLFLKYLFLIGGNSAFRREVLVKLNGFRPEHLKRYRLAEDRDVSVRLAWGQVKVRYDRRLVVFHSARRLKDRGLLEFIKYNVTPSVLIRPNDPSFLN